MCQKISGYFIIIISLLFFCASQSYAQKINDKALRDSTRIKEKEYKKEAKFSLDSFHRVKKKIRDSLKIVNNPDTIPFKKNLRIGFDLSKPVGLFFRKDRQELEFSADYHWKSRFYLAAELGYQHANINHPGYYTYNSSGEYLRAGFDYSIFRLEQKNDDNIVYLGLRLASANIRYKANNINIPDAYFGNTTASLPASGAEAYWLEFIFGIKVDIAKNLAIGWTLRIASGINDLTKRDTYPVLIPGFGNSSSTQNFTYNYSIYYSF